MHEPWECISTELRERPNDGNAPADDSIQNFREPEFGELWRSMEHLDYVFDKRTREKRNLRQLYHVRPPVFHRGFEDVRLRGGQP